MNPVVRGRARLKPCDPCNTFDRCIVLRGEMVPTDCEVSMPAGDMSSAEVYLKYRDGLTRFATVLVGRDDANDIVSAVVTRLLASGKQLGDLDNPQAYLMQAIANESRTLLRRRGRTAPLADMAVVDAVPQPEVLAAVMALPSRQRAATYLIFWVGVSSREAAVMLGCRPATVRRYLLLAKRKLRGVLDDYR